jgi:hypothetical protein
MIPLGHQALPTTTTELGQVIEGGVRRLLRLDAADPIAVHVLTLPDPHAETGTVQAVHIDLSGAEVSRARDITPRTFASWEPLLVQNVSVTGSPTIVRSLPVTLRVEANGLPLQQAVAEDGERWIIADTDEAPAGGRPAAGDLIASAAIADIETVSRAELERIVTAKGFALKKYALAIRPSGSRGVTIEADATVGKSLLSAKVTVTATVRIDDDFTLRISDVALSSGNPIVAALVTPVGARLSPYNGRSFALGEHTFAGARLTSLDLDVDSAIRVTAAFGA